MQEIMPEYYMNPEKIKILKQLKTGVPNLSFPQFTCMETQSDIDFFFSLILKLNDPHKKIQSVLSVVVGYFGQNDNLLSS